MKRDVVETGTAAASDGLTITVLGFSEDKDAGEPSAANRGAVELRIEGHDGSSLVIALAGAEAAKLVRPLVAGSVLTETEADVARRYLREHANTMYPYQIESLKRTAGMPYDQGILDAASEYSDL